MGASLSWTDPTYTDATAWMDMNEKIYFAGT